MAADTQQAPAGSMEEEPKQSAVANAWEFACAIWTSGVARLMPMLFLYIAGFGIILPFVPNLMIDFFATQAAGHAMHCERWAHDKPPVCVEAANTVVRWSSATGFVTNTVLLFLLSPMTGAWSDVVGRKPFIVVGQVLSLLPKFALYAHITSGLTLYTYYPLDVFNGAISPVVASLAYVADVLQPKYRGAGFGLVLAVFAAGIAVTPKVGYALGVERAITWGVWMKIAGIVYTFIWLPESLSAEARTLARIKRAEKKSAAGALYPTREERATYSSAGVAPAVCAWRAVSRFPPVRSLYQGFAILGRYPQFIKLTLCLMISGLVANGLSDIDNQYFILLFNFGAVDFSNIYVIFGLGTLIVQVALMQPVLSLLGERGCLVIAFLAAVVKGVLLSAAQTRGDVFAALVVGTIGVMSFPAISAIKANNVGPHEQGAVQGALSGAQALASGIGPLIFMRLFHIFTQREFGLPYLPRAVPLIAACVCLIPVILAASINMRKLAIRSAERTTADGAVLRDPLHEPLLPGERDARDLMGVCATRGGDIMAEEAAFAHRESDISAGLLLEGELWYARTHSSQGVSASGHGASTVRIDVVQPSLPAVAEDAPGRVVGVSALPVSAVPPPQIATVATAHTGSDGSAAQPPA